MRRKSGFTLVELIVVVAVAAALMAILMPSLRSATASARLAACASHVRQITLAGTSHVTDRRGHYPIGGQITQRELAGDEVSHLVLFDDGGTMRPTGYQAALAPYMGVDIRLDSRANLAADSTNPDLMAGFACPSMAMMPAVPTVRDASFSAPLALGNYGFNEAVCGYQPPHLRIFGKMSRIMQPASVMFAADARPRGGTTGWTNFYNHRNPANGPDQATLLDVYEFAGRGGDPAQFDYDRHDGRMVVSFCDGHVTTINMVPDQFAEVGISKGLK